MARDDHASRTDYYAYSLRGPKNGAPLNQVGAAGGGGRHDIGTGDGSKFSRRGDLGKALMKSRINWGRVWKLGLLLKSFFKSKCRAYEHRYDSLYHCSMGMVGFAMNR